MTLWLILATMTAAALAAVIWPLTRSRAATRSGSDVAVYRDQLEEIERDLAAGLIGKTEADAARIEISRRLLAAADAAAKADPKTGTKTGAKTDAAAVLPSTAAFAWRHRAAAIAAFVALPVIAGGLYLRLGSPDLASAQTFPEGSIAATGQSVDKLIAQAEAHVRQDPNDGRAWEVLAPVYMQIDRYSDSVAAWRNAVRLLGENAERDADLGEALMAEANGVVTAEAKADFVRAQSLDPTLVTARFYLGLAAEQDGQREQATKIWRALLADAPAGARWIPNVREALARVETGPQPPSDPSAAQMAAVANEPPAQQQATIEGMVDRLAARLKQDGSDVAGWARLIHAYDVMGQPDKARAATADARQALAGDSNKLDQLNAALKTGDAPAAPASAAGTDKIAQAEGSPPMDHQGGGIQGMVDRLAARLKQDGSDVNGWLQLIRSYNVLGQPDKASAATADARQALASDPNKLDQFNAGLKAAEAPPAATPAPGGQQQTGPAPSGAPPDHPQGATMETMVGHLAERLKSNGSDPSGWLMLVRSYVTMKQPDKAKAAIADARNALASDPAVLDEFNKALKNYNIND